MDSLRLLDEALHDLRAGGTFVWNLSVLVKKFKITKVVFTVGWSNIHWVIGCRY